MTESRLLAAIPGIGLRDDARLSRYTTYGIGGPARALAEPETADALAAALRACTRARTPVRILGGGSNLLVADAGFPGVVLRTRRLRALALDPHEPTLVHAEAGVGLARLTRCCADAGLAGPEVLAGIPGTVGGAVAMNAGGRHGEIAELLVAVDTLAEDGSRQRRHPVELGFGYRTSRLEGHAVIRVTLRCRAVGAPEARARLRTILREKALTQPLRARSAGCVFVNPARSLNAERPTPNGPPGAPPLSAGALIDRAGCKGLRVGGVEVSHRHANFFVNVGGGSASDVLVLAARVRARVFDRFGVLLEPELKLWSSAARDDSPFAAA